jgi:hypothetical protein
MAMGFMRWLRQDGFLRPLTSNSFHHLLAVAAGSVRQPGLTALINLMVYGMIYNQNIVNFRVLVVGVDATELGAGMTKTEMLTCTGGGQNACKREMLEVLRLCAAACGLSDILQRTY